MPAWTGMSPAPPVPVRRRALAVAAFMLTALGGVGLPQGTAAQARQRRIGFLSGASPGESTERNLVAPFRQGLKELGRVEGPALALHFRWGEGSQQRLPVLLQELLALELDVLVTVAPRAATLARDAASTVPVVAVAVDNPVQQGLAASFTRPGGRITGISSFGIELVVKRLQLLKELVPAARRIGILSNPLTSSADVLMRRTEVEARALGVTVQVVGASAPAELRPAFDLLAAGRADGLVVLADATFFVHRQSIGALCRDFRLPSVWGGRDYLDAGGLASYQSDFPALFRRAAVMVDLILKGARPAEMPFEQASKLELVVNLKAAQALGITVPRHLLLAADEVLR